MIHHTRQLSYKQLLDLIQSVFRPQIGEGDITLLTDLPSPDHVDDDDWADRRRICLEWYQMLKEHPADLPFRNTNFFAYANVGSNNNDLPDVVCPMGTDGILERKEVPLRGILADSGVVIAMTEFSATAPLKLLGKELGFRGATMPGFSRHMIPALGLEYEKVNDKVVQLKNRMDRVLEISIVLETSDRKYETNFDTRFREGHASGGLMRERGVVGNLPSGEAYIVPYEGEREGIASRSTGILPVQFGREIVLYEIRQNRASRVCSSGKKSTEEQEKLIEEPSYGNIAEIGIGVLGQWGVEACGSTLLDEKLGLHVAFGRSDHFGGATAPSSFREARNVVHIDRVYVPSVQPDIRVRRVTFDYGDTREDIIGNDSLLV